MFSKSFIMMYNDLLNYQTASEANFSLKSAVICMFVPWLYQTQLPMLLKWN